MWYWLVLCLVLYLICSVWFFLSSLMQVHLMWKAKRLTLPVRGGTAGALPFMTIQVPVYNERFVIARLLKSLANLNYPKELFEIQVLDDSTDDTSGIVAACAGEMRKQGIQISIIQRENRTGYKAGALQAGLPLCKGSLIVIFDADFTPRPDFLRKMVPHFENADVGGVQGRWLHRNLHQSWLTVIQSYLLDSHFTLEQQGRNSAHYYVNFNGTAGVWRKSCIEAMGGWNENVLTEDLELSYRAQLAGWKFLYDPTVNVPADLPVDLEAFKVQQFRWAKGISQVGRDQLKALRKMPIAGIKKLHGIFHLLGSVSFLAVFGNLLLALPLLAGRHVSPGFADLSYIIILSGLTLPVICIYYRVGTRENLNSRQFWLHLPVFLVVYMALSVQNSVAVLEAWTRKATPFVRTPKPGSVLKLYGDDSFSWTRINTLELLTLVYISITIVASLAWKDYFFLFFLCMAAAGLVILLSQPLSRAFRQLTSRVVNRPAY